MDAWRHIPSRLSVRISSITGDALSGAKNVRYTICAEEWTGHFVSGRLYVRVLRFLNCRKRKNLKLYAGQTLLLSLPPCRIHFTLILFVAFVHSVSHSLLHFLLVFLNISCSIYASTQLSTTKRNTQYIYTKSKQYIFKQIRSINILCCISFTAICRSRLFEVTSHYAYVCIL